MQLVIVEMRTQFNAGNYANAELGAGGDCLGQSVYRVMIGQRDRVQIRIARRFDDLRRRERAVRCGRVYLQVDELRGLAASRNSFRARYARYFRHVR